MLGTDHPSIQQAVSCIPSMLDDADHNGSVLCENVMLQEWLQKRSTSLQLVWKRRWCVLQDGHLYYYRSNTDSKPLGVLHLAEYSVLASGPEISRKSKLAFRLSSPEPIPHQHQHHVFFTETPQSLERWLHALQIQINHAVATVFSLPTPATGLGLQFKEQVQRHRAATGAFVGEQSIIDKVLDRLQLEDSTMTEINDPAASSSGMPVRMAPAVPGTGSTPLPHLPSNFPQSYEDNNDTWSSTSSLPMHSTNTSTNLEYIFAMNQQNQHTHLKSKSSADTVSEKSQHSLQSPLDTQQMGVSGPEASLTGSYSSSTGYPAGAGLTDQQTPNTPDLSRSSAESSGRPSLQQARVNASGYGPHSGSSSFNSFIHQHPQSPRTYPLRTSVHSGVSMDNSGASPATSAAGSPFSSPTLTSQPHSIINSVQGGIAPQSPRAFYRVLENISTSKRPESIASSASISTIASSGDVSTINDLASDSGLSVTAAESNQSKAGGSSSHGSSLLSLMTGGKHKKDKERQTNSSSSSIRSGSGSGVKLFSTGICMFSGCTQSAKTCPYHNKKYRASSPKTEKDNDKAKEKEKDQVKEKDKDKGSKSKDTKKLKKLWSGSDRNPGHGAISVITGPIVHTDGPPSPSCSSGRVVLSSKSMTSLARNTDFGVDSAPVPLMPTNLLGLVSPTRQRSPSVSVVDDALIAAQQQHKQAFNSDPIQHMTKTHIFRSQTPLPGPPSQPLPPPPPRASSSASNHRPNVKETFSLSRKMGLQMGSEFGTIDKNALAGTTLDGNFFVANHHRTMQKLHALQSWKSQPTGPLPPPPGKQWSPQQQQQQLKQQQRQQELQRSQQSTQYPVESQKTPQPQDTNMYNGGVSRHIIAPVELAHAIEQEAEELRKLQAQEKEAQKSRPTSMIRPSFQSMPMYMPMSMNNTLSTVAETAVSANEGASTPISRINNNNSPGDFQETKRIISCQEQLACAPIVLPAVDAQRSPISGIVSAPSPLSPLRLVAPMLPHDSNAGVDSSVASSSSEKTNALGSSRSNSVAAASEIPSPASGNYLASLNRPNKAHPLSAASLPGYFPQQPPAHPLSPMSISMMSDRSEIPMRSLPPPKRHANEYKGLESKIFQRGGLPRRSSAAAVVTTYGASVVDGVTNNIEDPDDLKSPHPSSSTTLRPSYMARRQSSSPVLIRVSDQGGQNISPLLTDGATRTFTGDAPAREVLLRRPGLSPLSSVSGNSSYSTTSTTGSLCSIVTSRHNRKGDGSNQLHLGEDGDKETAGEVSLTKPNSSITSSSEGGTTSKTPAHAFRRASSSLANVTTLDVPELTTSSDIADPKDLVLPDIVNGSPVKKSLLPSDTFRFPASTSTTARSKGSNADDHRNGKGRPLSACSSAGSFTESVNSHDDNYDDRSGHSSRAESPLLSPSLHAAALELYPGLRKLSLFTAAVGGHPPPALLSGRKGSSGSGSRDYHHGSTAAESSDQSVDDDEGEESSEQEHEEDWAGNLKSARRGINDHSLPLKTAATKTLLQDLRRPSLPFSAPATRPSHQAPPQSPLQRQQQMQLQQQQNKITPASPVSRFASPPPLSTLPPLPPTLVPSTPQLSASAVDKVSSVSVGTASLPPSPLSVSSFGAPPAVPRRSPHRSAPASPSTLRSQKSNQSLPPVPTLNASEGTSALSQSQNSDSQYI
ncbi:hypothetical protein BGX28_007857 [Mortierella sp. GBA30]|nr:hypothetical protein BGX28_007857 [Mortierella sp. GBA30]